jgi:3-dehydroquinate dehydratase-2
VASILLLHGPNLNLLGQREPAIYGTTTLADHQERVIRAAADRGHTVEVLQSNHEGELVDAIHSARGRHVAIIINAGALTHYSWSIHDALGAFEGRVVEVHISNPHARESFRHVSVVAPKAVCTIAGLGAKGYDLAVRAAVVNAPSR